MRRISRYLLIVAIAMLILAITRLIANSTTDATVVAQQTTVAQAPTTDPGTPTAAAKTAEAGLTAIAATNPPPTASLPVPTITLAPVPIVTPLPTTRTGALQSGPPTATIGTTQTDGGTAVDGWAVAGIIILLAIIAIVGGAGYRMYALRHNDRGEDVPQERAGEE